MRTPERALREYNADPTVELLKSEIVLIHMKALGKVPLVRYQYDLNEKQLVEVQSVAYEEQAEMFAKMLYTYGQTFYPEFFPADETTTNKESNG